MRVTSNWLIGLTRYQEVINAFPWMNTLANKYRVNTGKGCGGCGQQKVIRAVTDHVNDTMRILATIPEEDVARFKALTTSPASRGFFHLWRPSHEQSFR